MYPVLVLRWILCRAACLEICAGRSRFPDGERKTQVIIYPQVPCEFGRGVTETDELQLPPAKAGDATVSVEPLVELQPTLLVSWGISLRLPKCEPGVGGTKAVVDGGVTRWAVLRKYGDPLRGAIRSGSPVRIMINGALFG